MEGHGSNDNVYLYPCTHTNTMAGIHIDRLSHIKINKCVCACTPTHTPPPTHWPIHSVLSGGSFTAQKCGPHLSNLDEWLRSYIMPLMSDYFYLGGSRCKRAAGARKMPHLWIWVELLLVWAAELLIIDNKSRWGVQCLARGNMHKLLMDILAVPVTTLC